MIRKVWLQTFVQGDGERIPWLVSLDEGKLSPKKHDDRIEEVWLMTDEALAEVKRQEALSLIEELQSWCKSVLWNNMDINRGETATANEALEFLMMVVAEAHNKAPVKETANG
jgi:hypothetical protein